MIGSKNRIWRALYSTALAVTVAGLYLYLTLTAWDSFIFDAARYDPTLREVRELVQGGLVFTGGMLFAIVAALTAPPHRPFQLLVCGAAVFWWLYPYGFIEGSFLPILPLTGALVALSGAYLGSFFEVRSPSRNPHNRGQ
jgi:hypothetical protein